MAFPLLCLCSWGGVHLQAPRLDSCGELEQKASPSFSPRRGDRKGGAEGSSSRTRGAQGVLGPSDVLLCPVPGSDSPGARLQRARSPLSGLAAVSAPSKEPQRERMSMCFLNQKGGLSSARAAQANRQKPVNGKLGAAGRSHDNKTRTIISPGPARRRDSL